MNETTKTLPSQATAEWALQLAAQAWCEPTTSAKVMDEALATVFAQILTRLAASFEADRASRAQSEWQSMDSAPKDGTTVYLHVSGHVYEGSWLDIPFSESRDADGHYLDQQDAEAYWMDHERGDTLEPTEWMPKNLPKPPATLGETK